MSDVAVIESGAGPLATLKAFLLKKKPDIDAAISPRAGFNADEFISVVITAAATNPDIFEADKRTLFVACMKAAHDGLQPDGREAALVIFNSKTYDRVARRDVWVKAVQYMPMLTGIIKMAHQTREISSFEAQAIYAEDDFDFEYGSNQFLRHKPKFPSGEGRGPVVGAWALVRWRDPTRPPQFRVLDEHDIKKIRAASKAGDKVWGPWLEEMAAKSAARRLAKYLPRSPFADILERDDELGVIDGEAAETEAETKPAARPVGTGKLVPYEQSPKLDILKSSVKGEKEAAHAMRQEPDALKQEPAPPPPPPMQREPEPLRPDEFPPGHPAFAGEESPPDEVYEPDEPSQPLFDEPSTQPKPQQNDKEWIRAQGVVDDMKKCSSVPAMNALLDQAANKRMLIRWNTERPEIFQFVKEERAKLIENLSK